MNESRSLRDRFWASSSWAWWKQLLVATAVLLLLGGVLSVFTTSDDSGPSSSSDAPQPVVAQSTTDASSPVEITPFTSGQSAHDTSAAQPASTASPTGNSGPKPSDGDAISILATIPVEREHGAGYSRDLFAVWLDVDGDGCDTRDEVLVGESLSPPQPGVDACLVPSGGGWYSIYDGETTTDPSMFDVDHVVSLKEAWDSGAWNWEPSRRIAFGNDLTDQRTLVAVSDVSNRSKGDADPSNWLPMEDQICQYVADWVSIKARWSLSMDESEYGRIRNLLRGDCQGTTISAWTPAPQ